MMLSGTIKLLISSSALILAIIVIRALFKNGISRRLRYGLWGIVLLRLIIPINLFSSPVSVMNSVGAMDNFTSSQITSHIVDRQHNDKIQNVNTESTLDANKDLNGGTSSGQTKQVQSASEGTINTEQLFLLIWVLGLIITAIWFTAVNLKLWLKLRKGFLLDHIQDDGVNVYLVEMDDSPCLFGLFNPSIYLSPQAIEDKQGLGFILAHELAHYRHLDYIWSFSRIVLLCVYWYNPLVWIAAWLSKIDCEEACDEAVVKELGTKNRIEYGRTLLKMIPLKNSPQRLITASTSMSAGKKAITKRISAIAANKKSIVVCVISVLLLTVVAAGCTFSDASNSDDNTPTESVNDSQQSPVQSETPSSPEPSPEPTVYTESVTNGIHVSVATDELYDRFDSMHEYVENEEGEWIIIWPETTITDFKFLSAYNYYDDELNYFMLIEDVLFSVEELTPEKPLALKWMPYGEINSGFGISYIDENGVQRYYLICMGGRGPEEAPPYGLEEFDSVKVDTVGERLMKEIPNSSDSELIALFQSWYIYIDGAYAEAYYVELSERLMEDVVTFISLLAKAYFTEDQMDAIAENIGINLYYIEPVEKIQAIYDAQSGQLTEQESRILTKIINSYENYKEEQG